MSMLTGKSASQDAVVGGEWGMETSAKYVHHLSGITGLTGTEDAESKGLGKNGAGFQERGDRG